MSTKLKISPEQAEYLFMAAKWVVDELDWPRGKKFGPPEQLALNDLRAATEEIERNNSGASILESLARWRKHYALKGDRHSVT